MPERFHYTFSADLSELDGTSASNGTIAQSSGAGLNGTSGGVVLTRTGNSPNLYGFTIEEFPVASVIRTAWYTDLSSLTIGTDNNNTTLMRVHIAGGDKIALATVVRVSGSLSFRLYTYNDAGGFSANTVSMGLPEWLEMRIERASGVATSDGNSQLYAGGGDYAVLGELVAEVTGVDNYDHFIQTNRLLFGMHDALAASNSIGGVITFDEWFCRDDDTPILFGVSSGIAGKTNRYIAAIRNSHMITKLKRGMTIGRRR